MLASARSWIVRRGSRGTQIIRREYNHSKSDITGIYLKLFYNRTTRGWLLVENYWLQPNFFEKTRNTFLRLAVMPVNDKDFPRVYRRRRRWIYGGGGDALRGRNFGFELGNDSLDMTQPIKMLTKVVTVYYVFKFICVI